MTEKLKFTKEQLLDIICQTCTNPGPVSWCAFRRDGERCAKCINIARQNCKKTSLENEVIFDES